jgi:hypothetical protein
VTRPEVRPAALAQNRHEAGGTDTAKERLTEAAPLVVKGRRGVPVFTPLVETLLQVGNAISRVHFTLSVKAHCILKTLTRAPQTHHTTTHQPQRANNWDFDIFDFNAKTNGNPLKVVLQHVFNEFEFFDPR